jgi:hypothetical protein
MGSAFGSDLGLNAGLEKFLNAQEAAVVKNGFTGANMKAWVGDQSRPAVAAELRREGMIARAPSSSPAEVDQHIHSHVTLQVDGEKLAEAHSTAKRSAAARGYRDVPATAGSY